MEPQTDIFLAAYPTTVGVLAAVVGVLILVYAVRTIVRAVTR